MPSEKKLKKFEHFLVALDLTDRSLSRYIARSAATTARADLIHLRIDPDSVLREAGLLDSQY